MSIHVSQWNRKMISVYPSRTSICFPFDGFICFVHVSYLFALEYHARSPTSATYIYMPQRFPFALVVHRYTCMIFPTVLPTSEPSSANATHTHTQPLVMGGVHSLAAHVHYKAALFKWGLHSRTKHVITTMFSYPEGVRMHAL